MHGWHPEVLAQRQQRVLERMGPLLTKRGFFLVGGTAIALHLGHRRSVDLDWFSPTLPDPATLADDLRTHGIRFVTTDVAPGTLHGTVGGVRVSMLRHRYPAIGSVRKFSRGIDIAGIPDLAALKLLAVAQRGAKKERGAKKDFVDIYALGKRADSLQQLLQWYRRKFAVEDDAHLIRSLSYFDDAQKERLPRMLWDVNWRIVKATIQRWLQDVPR